jgi:hypothetical protein
LKIALFGKLSGIGEIKLGFGEFVILLPPNQQLTNIHSQYPRNPKQHLHPRLRTIRTPLRDRSRVYIQLLRQPFIADSFFVENFPDAIVLLHDAMTLRISIFPSEIRNFGTK